MADSTPNDPVDPKGLQLDPHHLRGQPHAWWYEEDFGITVVVEPDPTKDGNVDTRQIKIPWRTLRAALGRKDA